MDEKERLKEIMNNYSKDTIGLYQELMKVQKKLNHKTNTKIKEAMMQVIEEVIE